MKRVRCAIYTRKSSEEGLEQDFNSLDAQREACAAYVLSQASEGWSLVPERYDDGGISGGTLERPALQQLLGDIAAGKIDIVVVYKVDRLTRSLIDFSKLVEAFDNAGTSFVSVTQSFNTTTSMGRLTLNMLLSFAQFEREVTAERIRDKIAASKAKGMWMGGTPPLGYAPDGRSLRIVDEEAGLVRMLFRRCLERGNVPALLEELARDRVVMPLRTLGSGRTIGGTPFRRGPLYHLLKNPIYVGDIRHRHRIYPGSHPPVIDRALWEAVQALLGRNRQGTARRTRAASPSPLAGKLVDERGAPLVAAHTSKQVRSGTGTSKVRYRYYVSRALQHDRSGAGLRIPATEIERAVAERIAAALDDPLGVVSACGVALDAVPLATLMTNATALAAQLRKRDRRSIEEMVRQVRILPSSLEIDCCAKGLMAALGVSEAPLQPKLTLAVQVRLTRSGHVMRLVDERGCAAAASPSQPLVRLIALAHRYWQALRTEPIDVTRLAAREGVTRSYLTRVLRLAFLSPDVTDAILSGRHRAGIDGAMLTATDAIDADWGIQRQRLLASG